MKLKELLAYGALERPGCDADPSLELSAEFAPDEIMSRLFTYFGEDPERSGVWLKLPTIRARHFRRVDLYALVPDMRKTLATEVEPPALRYLNLVLGHRRGTRLPATQALDEAASYQIVLWIGERALESVVANAPAFPDVVLPRDQEEHRLQLVAHSDDVVIAKPHRILRLPGKGDSQRISIGFRTPEARELATFVSACGTAGTCCSPCCSSCAGDPPARARHSPTALASTTRSATSPISITLPNGSSAC